MARAEAVSLVRQQVLLVQMMPMPVMLLLVLVLVLVLEMMQDFSRSRLASPQVRPNTINNNNSNTATLP